MKRVSEGSLEYVNGHYFLDDEPFTGVGVAQHPDGWLQVEIEYKYGLKWGMQREWFAPDQLLTEAELQSGVVHGKRRFWHRNGKLAEEGEYEFGVTLRRKKWDEDGKLVEDFELKEEPDSNFDFLEKLRTIRKKQNGDLWADLLRNSRLHPWRPGEPIPSLGPRILLGLDSSSPGRPGAARHPEQSAGPSCDWPPGRYLRRNGVPSDRRLRGIRAWDRQGVPGSGRGILARREAGRKSLGQ